MTKLKVINDWTTDNIQFACQNVALDDDTLIVLGIDNQDQYSLTVFTREAVTEIALPYLEGFLSSNDQPVLFARDGQFGIIATTKELYHYAGINNDPEKMTIEDSGFFNNIIPKTARKRYISTITDSDILPVGFEDELFAGNARYYGLIKIDLVKKAASWIAFSFLDYSAFPAHADKSYPPKIDSLQILQNELYAYVSGGSITSVNKWGMDYYGLARVSQKGRVLENFIDSGNLKTGDKKRGVNGIFAAHRDYLIMTPVFASDEWKGKQKIYSLKARNFVDVELPRGKTKFKLIQVTGNSFWIYLYDGDQKHFALCKHSEAEAR